MDFWFKNNLRASATTGPGPVMTSCGTTVISNNSVTISGAATASGGVASYTVRLNGPTAINDAAAGSGASFSRSYNVASGSYTGSVTATDTLGQVSTACPLAQFQVGSAPPWSCTAVSASNYAHAVTHDNYPTGHGFSRELAPHIKQSIIDHFLHTL